MVAGLELFQRCWRVTVGTIQMTDVDVEFHVKKTLKQQPNTCDLKIYNLNLTHRKMIEQQASTPSGTTMKVPVRIEAGLNKHLAQIFLGELRAGWSVTDGPEVVTELSTGDGEKELATARLNVSIGAGMPIDIALREIVTTLGVGAGNVNQAVAMLKAKGLTQFSIKSQVLKGNCADCLTDLCKGSGLEWSVQDQAVQILTLGQPLPGQALRLSSDTGLEGSPSVDSKGILTFQTLMIPGLKPGALVVMDSEHIKGGYRVETCEYEGDTLGNDWGIKCSASKY